MKKMPPHKSSLREVYGERDWGPTVDGRILPRHPFDPGAPPISANVPLLTGTNLHEFVNGLDRPDANVMGGEELNRLIGEAFGDHSKRSSTLTGASIPIQLRLIFTPQLQPPLAACLRAGHQEGCFGGCASLFLCLFLAHSSIR